jgi:hypothetical protein
VIVHHQVRRRIRIDDGPYAHDVRVRYLGENGALERKSMQRAKEVALDLRRMRADGNAIGGTRDETAREKFLDDDDVTIELVFRVIAEREWARSAKATNDAKTVSEQCSRAERERVRRLQDVGGHTFSGGEARKLVAQRMPVEWVE